MKGRGKAFVLAGGGTGGHLVPGLVLAEVLSRDWGIAPILVTGKRPVEDRVLAGAPWERLALDLEGPPFRVLLRLPGALARTAALFRSRPVGGVLILGGRIGIPAAFLARAAGIPLFLLEVNALPGKTTRFLAPFARRIFLGYARTAPFFHPGRVRIRGIPVRPSFFSLPDREEARRDLALPSGGGPVLLVVGGSMGARSLNEALPRLLAGRLPAGTRVVHIAGADMEEEVRRAWRSGGIRARVFPFLRAVDTAFAAADLAICRGGALTMGEVAAARLPALVVPYPWHKDRHQEANAAPLAEEGGVLVLPQEELEHRVAREVAGLLGDRERLERMRAALGRVSLAAPGEPLAEELVVEGRLRRR